jgi:hypothetical protein
MLLVKLEAASSACGSPCAMRTSPEIDMLRVLNNGGTKSMVGLSQGFGIPRLLVARAALLLLLEEAKRAAGQALGVVQLPLL